MEAKYTVTCVLFFLIYLANKRIIYYDKSGDKNEKPILSIFSVCRRKLY